MLLYDSPVSGNCYKVRLLFAHLGIEYERRTVDVVDRSDPREFLDGLNPARRVPTLVLDDDRALAESNAILWYFGEGSRFVPDDPYARAQVLQWQFWEQYEHEPAIAVARFLKTYSGRADIWEKRRARLTAEASARSRRWSAYLDGRDWFVGDGMTLADITLYAYTHAADEGGFSLDDKPAIRRWLDRVAAEPGHVAIDA